MADSFLAIIGPVNLGLAFPDLSLWYCFPLVRGLGCVLRSFPQLGCFLGPNGASKALCFCEIGEKKTEKTGFLKNFFVLLLRDFRFAVLGRRGGAFSNWRVPNFIDGGLF